MRGTTLDYPRIHPYPSNPPILIHFPSLFPPIRTLLHTSMYSNPDVWCYFSTHPSCPIPSYFLSPPIPTLLQYVREPRRMVLFVYRPSVQWVRYG